MYLDKIRTFGLLGSIKLFISLIYTRIFFSKAKLIRLPFDIRNRAFISIGNNFVSGFGCRLEAYPEVRHKTTKHIHIGNNVEINDYVHISAIKSVFIGDNVLIASKVFISDNNHGTYRGEFVDSPNSIPKDRVLNSASVSIEKNVWLGESVCVLPGVTIGEGSIIGALSVVSKNIPKHSIAVGSPAKVIKKYNFKSKSWDNL